MIRSKKNWLFEILSGKFGRGLVIAVPMIFLLLVFLLPFLVVVKISLAQMGMVLVQSIWSWKDQVFSLSLNIGNYISLVTDHLYVYTYISSIKFSFITTILCLIIAYPFAYFMARSPAAYRSALLMMVMLPFWTSFLLRVYAWKILLSDNGVFNNAFMALGVIHEPLRMMNTAFSLQIGMVYSYVPFMILPLYSNLVKMDLSLLEAALDLGATPWQAFWRITVPLSKSGIIAGSMLVFIPCTGEYVIPELLGGPSTLMIGRVLWDEFFGNNDWPRAASVAVIMVLIIVIPMAFFNKYQAESMEKIK
jgi:putrescine transport system permease protein